MDNMTEYFTAARYQRWLRQYQVNMNIYIDQLNDLRVRVDALNDRGLRQRLEKKIDEIDEHLDKASPRNFGVDAKPLTREEQFLENGKVFINLILNLFKKPVYFSGVYQAEKDRIQKEHQVFKFKEKLKELNDMIDEAENADYQMERIAQASSS